MIDSCGTVHCLRTEVKKFVSFYMRRRNYSQPLFEKIKNYVCFVYTLMDKYVYIIVCSQLANVHSP